MMVTLFLQAMYFQNRGAFKAPYDEMSSSSKINPLSLFSSSANHRTASTDAKQQLKPIRKGTSISSKTEGSQRKGIWITTDTDCNLLSLFSSPKPCFLTMLSVILSDHGMKFDGLVLISLINLQLWC